MNLVRYKSPPQREGLAELREFHYSRLTSQTTGFRLAQILPGTGNKGIAIRLVDSYLTGSRQIPYDALSYTWGDGMRNKNVKCNGKRLLVTKTLLQALQRFRDPTEEITLWIDQLCINQSDTAERNGQVQLMGDIFKGARKVIVWLGEDYDDSQAGIRLARQLLNIARYQPVSGLGPSDLDTHGLPRQNSKPWKALAAILRRPWFWRTWVVQEVVLNPNVEFVLGSHGFTWDELESIVALLEGPIERAWHLDQAMSAFELPFSRMNRIRLRHRRMIVTPISLVQADPRFDDYQPAEPEIDTTEEYGDNPDILDLLLMSRSLGATDPRDKVYALLALGKHNIEPDYDLTPEGVFNTFAQQTIGNVTTVRSRREAQGLELSPHDREVRRAFILLACAGKQNQSRDLPSWVPDWTVSLSSRPLIFGLGNLKFSAGGDKFGVFDWRPETGQGGLELSGILLDMVQAVGSVHLDLDAEDGTDPHTLIERWWREAQEVALSRIARSPGSTGFTDAFEAMRRRLNICKHGYYVGERASRSHGSLLNDADPGSNTSHSALQTLMLGPTRGRVIFASAVGFLGLVPYGTMQGDMLFVIRGAAVPFVLRPHGDVYELIGEAYVQGVMHGEALNMDQLLPQELVIC